MSTGEPLFTFEEAINEEKLLKSRFSDCSMPQQVVLKAAYGLPLNEEELYYWRVFQEQCEVDDLGYVMRITKPGYAYEPKEYSQIVCTFGRRSGKTDRIGATMIAYEAALGGHHQFVSKSQTPYIYVISHKKENSLENLGFVRDALESSPILNKQIANTTSESITLKNGVCITGAHPSIRGQRGLAVPMYVADEANFWYSDENAANPDTAVQTALRYAQRQFPRAKRVWLSTPYVKRGVFYGMYEAGTQGVKLHNPDVAKKFKSTLVCWAPTAAMDNPIITRERLEEELLEDPEKYEQESNARFADSVSGFLSSNLLRGSVDHGVSERAPSNKYDYVMAIDPAFRGDSFGLVVVHRHEGKVYVDYVQRWTPEKGVPLNPSVVLDEVAHIAKQYRVQTVFTDQYQNDSLRELALDRGLMLNDIAWTTSSKPAIWANFRNTLNHGKLVMLDPELNADAKTLFTELVRLEKVITAANNVQIRAPRNEHDDLAMCIGMAVNQAMMLNSEEGLGEPEWKEPTPFEIIMKQLDKNRADLEYGGSAW